MNTLSIIEAFAIKNFFIKNTLHLYVFVGLYSNNRFLNTISLSTRFLHHKIRFWAIFVHTCQSKKHTIMRQPTRKTVPQANTNLVI